MNGHILCVTLLIALTQAKPHFYYNTYVSCSLEEEGQLKSNPEDCCSFFECAAGTPVLEKCTPGLQWNDATKLCDYKHVVNCRGYCSTEEISTTKKPFDNVDNSVPSKNIPRPADHCPAENGEEDVLLPNPADCTTFFKCLTGVPILEHCPAGLQWSVDLNRCEYPEIAKCHETATKPTQKPTTGSSGERTTASSIQPTSERPDHCPAENGEKDVLLPNPADCTTFFKCLAGVPILEHCPPGLQWSVDLNRCEYPEVAKCHETATKPTQKPTTESSGKPTTASSIQPTSERPDHCPAENGEEDVLLPNPADCTTFYKCLAGVPILEHCPPGLQWSVDLNRCEYPEVAKCHETATKPTQKPTTQSSGERTTASSIQPTSERPDHCPAENGEEDVLLPNPADCSTFFKCLAGVPILEHCPPGLQWSVDLNRCEYPNIAKCKETSTGINNTIPPKKNDISCPTVNNGFDILLPNPDDCHTFFKCDNGIPQLMHCPEGTLWNAEMVRCDFSDVAKCSTA